MPVFEEREKLHFASGDTSCAAWHYPGTNGGCVIISHSDAGVNRLDRVIDHGIGLVTPAAGEALLGPAAGGATTLDQPAADLGRDQLGTGEDSRRVAALADEQHADQPGTCHVLEQAAVRDLGADPHRGEGRRDDGSRTVRAREDQAVGRRLDRRRSHLVLGDEPVQPAFEPLGRDQRRRARHA